MSGSATRSGAKRARLVSSRWNSQPMCAYQQALEQRARASRRSATASAGRPRGRRTRGGGGGRPPTASARPRAPCEPATASAIRSAALRLERAVGEVAVVADRDAEARRSVEDERRCATSSTPGQSPAPRDRYRGHQREERHHHEAPQADQNPERLLAFGQRLRTALRRNGLLVQERCRHGYLGFASEPVGRPLDLGPTPTPP